MPIERVTDALLIILWVLLQRPDDEHYGYAIAKETGLTGARVQQTLARLEAEEWLTSRVETIDPHEAGRRPRKLYKFTASGVQAAAALVAEHAPRRRLTHSILGRLSWSG
jgi:DNA-binding PadR family transcriptional regulator